MYLLGYAFVRFDWIQTIHLSQEVDVYTGPCTGLRILFRLTILWDWETIILLAFRYWKVQKRAYELLPRSFDSIFANYKCIFNCYLLCISCSGYHCAVQVQIAKKVCVRQNSMPCVYRRKKMHRGLYVSISVQPHRWR